MQLSVFNVVDGVKLKWCAVSCTTTEIQYSFSGPTLWTFLPLNIRNSQTIYSFKRHYKCFLLKMLYIRNTAISVIVCNCIRVFAISFIVHIIQKHWFLGSFNTKALLPGTILCPLWYVFTARCYASAVLAMALCPSVRPFVCLLSVRHKSVFY